MALRAGLDAGCGAGTATLALLAALEERAIEPGPIHGFDLTPAMLDRFACALAAADGSGIELRQADALDLPRTLPDTWTGYDLIVSSGMLEHVPEDGLVEVLRALRARLAPGGRLLLFASRRNIVTRLLIGRWWRARTFSRPELAAALAQAGFDAVVFRPFPRSHGWVNTWGLAVEAVKDAGFEVRRADAGPLRATEA